MDQYAEEKGVGARGRGKLYNEFGISDTPSDNEFTANVPFITGCWPGCHENEAHAKKFHKDKEAFTPLYQDELVAPSPVSDPAQRKKWEGLPPPGHWPGDEPRQKAAGLKQAWMGWGPAQQSHHHRVAGWDWDDHLAAYTANRPGRFTCSCGHQMSMPGHHECHCGRLYNGYVIGTGGSNHEAAAEKYLVRELMVRPDVIVARQAAGDYETDEDWPSEHHPKVKKEPHKTPPDWAHRGPKNEFARHPMPRRPSPQTQPAQL